MRNNIKEKILAANADFLIPNLNALGAWSALYDNDYKYVSNWLENEAPNEHGEFCTLDRFAYFVKLRVYFAQGKHLAFLGLAERLKPILIAFDRQMEQCELNLLLALSYYEQGHNEQAFELLDNTLILCEKYRFNRLVGDEGLKMYSLLSEYAIDRGETSYLNDVIEIAKTTGLLYPDYLKSSIDKLPKLTKSELEVLQLLAAERTNAQIAKLLFVTERTIKFHCSNIFSKLNVKNRRQAIKVSNEAGIT